METLKIDTGGRAQVVSVSAVSAQSAALVSESVRIVSTVNVFVRRGSNPTAVVNVDLMIPANTPTILTGFNITGQNAYGAGAAAAATEKLAFVAGGAGSVYISPL